MEINNNTRDTYVRRAHVFFTATTNALKPSELQEQKVCSPAAQSKYLETEHVSLSCALLKLRQKHFQCLRTFIFHQRTFLNASISLFLDGVRVRAPGLVVGSGSLP